MVSIQKTIRSLTLLELPDNTPITKEQIQTQFRNLSRFYLSAGVTETYDAEKKFDELAEAMSFLLNNLDEVNSLIRNGFHASSTSDSQSSTKSNAEAPESLSHDKTQKIKKTMKWAFMAIFVLIFVIAVQKVFSSGNAVGYIRPSTTQFPQKATSSTYTVKMNNGWVLRPQEECECPMQVNAPKNAPVYVSFVKSGYFSPSFSVFVNAGSSYEFDAPIGLYNVYYATGTNWISRGALFGEDTVTYKCDSQFENYIEGNTAYGNEITLYLVSDGNLTKTEISVDNFPK